MRDQGWGIGYLGWGIRDRLARRSLGGGGGSGRGNGGFGGKFGGAKPRAHTRRRAERHEERVDGDFEDGWHRRSLFSNDPAPEPGESPGAGGAVTPRVERAGEDNGSRAAPGGE